MHHRDRYRLTALIMLLLLSQAIDAADDIHVWIRAFIPEANVVTNSSTAAVATPTVDVLRISDGGCIATDQRSWSDAASARSRVASDFHLLFDANAEAQLRPSGKQVTIAGGLKSVDCGSGADVATQPVQLLADEVRTPVRTDEGVQIGVLAAVADPVRPWSSATVHYDATFTYDPASRTLAYQALTGFFPAYEAYAALNDGPVIKVFRSGPVRAAVTASGSEKTEAAGVELKGTVNLGDAGKRPKAPTNFRVE